MKNLRKAIVVSVMSVTVLSMSMLAVPFTVGAAASAGDLIKMDGLSSVYFLGGDGKRYVFPNEATYFSWYDDFSGVVTIPQSELESYPLGANVTMRPGTKLVKITTDPKVYAVTPGGVLKHVPDEATAQALWGENWAQRVVDVPDAFFTNYTIGSGTVSATAYPAGSVVKFGGADIYYIAEDGTARKFADEAALMANRYSMSDVVDSTLTAPTTGTEITGAEGDLTDTSEGAGGTAGAGTGVTVSLSGTTAPSNTVIIGQASANLASFVFTASNDGDVQVNSVKVKRTGLSADSDLTSVYLYSGTDRLTDNASVSSGYITWNNASGIFTIPAGTSKTITVRADISGSASSGSTVGVQFEAASGVTTDGAAVSGSFPISGNLMSLASVSSFATVAMNGTTYPSANVDVDAGEENYTVWKNSASVGNRAVYLHSIRLRQIGSVLSGDLNGFEFYVDGVKKGEASLVNNYVYFEFDTPIKLETGTRMLELRADFVSGSTRTTSFSLQYATDIVVTDSDYGANVKASAVPATTATMTISSGSLTVTKATDSPSGNVTADASNVTLAKFEFKAYGEPIKVEYVRIHADVNHTNVGELRNGALYANGVQVGSTADIYDNTSGTTWTDYSLGSSMVVNPGTPVVLEVRADIYDSDGTNNITSTSTIQISLDQYTNGAQRQNSLTYFDYPSTSVPANSLSVSVGTMTLAKKGTYGDQTTVLPQTAYKLGEFTLTGNSTETVNLNTVTVNILQDTGATFGVADIADAYLVIDDYTSSIKNTVSASSSWSVNISLGVNETVNVAMYGNIESVNITTGHSGHVLMKVSGITSQSSETVNSTASGQVIAAGTGSITAAKDASSPVATIVKGGTTVDVASYEFTTTYDSYEITEMVVTFTGTANTVVGNVILMDGTTQLASKPLSNLTATFSGLAIPVPADDSKVIDVKVVLGSVGTGAGTTGSNIKATLASFKADNSLGSEYSNPTANIAGNNIYVHKAIPTISMEDLPTTLISTGIQTIAKFTITGDGTIGWKKMVLDFSYSNVGTTSNPVMYNADTNQEVSGTWTDTMSTLTFVADTEEEVSGSKTYLVKWNITDAASSGDTFSVNITRPATKATNDYDTIAGASGSFIWTDQGINGHATSTLDWTNDAYVKNLPTDSWTMTR